MLNVTLSLLSVLASVLIAWIGGNMIFRAGPWNRALGIVSIGYAMMSGVLLLTAWLQPRPAMPTVSKYLSFLFLAALVARLALEVKVINRAEQVTFVLALVLLLINWLAVKKLVDSSPNTGDD